MTAPHRPLTESHPQFGRTARCLDCRWRQTFDEDLHEFAEDQLLHWHVEHPEHGHDHLSADGITTGLQVPAYVRWAPWGDGLLALADDRTGTSYHGYNHESLAIFRSAAEGAELESAVRANARRLDITPNMARADIVAVAVEFYRQGLLQPRPRTREQAEEGSEPR